MPENADTHIKWYFRPAIIVIAILVLQPFAIPLIWKSPALGTQAKIWLTVLALVLTILIVILTVVAVKTYISVITSQMQDLQNLTR